MLKLSDRGFLAEAEKKMGGFRGKLGPLGAPLDILLGFTMPRRFRRPARAGRRRARTASTRSPARASMSAFAMWRPWSRCWSTAKRLGLDLGDPQLLARYERWRSLDTFMVAAATDGLTRLFGIPGRTASAVRRFGLSAVQKLPPLKDRFMAEARGESGDVPKLLQGLTV